jgi:hypothetical protein
MTYGTRIRWSKDGSQFFGSTTDTAPTKILDSTSPAFLDGNNDFNVYTWKYHALLQLATPVKVVRVGLRFASAPASNLIVRGSADSTDGYNGTWTDLFTYSNSLAIDKLYEFAVSGVVCKWIKLWQLPNQCALKTLHVFGEYQSPRFEFWDAAGTSELDNDYPLAFENALKSADYSHIETFRIKNLDAAAHNYTVTVEPVRYQGEAFITDYARLSIDGGTTKVTSISIAGLAAGALSGVISVCMDFAKTNNPADGPHYFAINVTEN